ncbi:MAG TPA: GerAB/ArcD/ProY family transporter [Bacillota bacterium]
MSRKEGTAIGPWLFWSIMIISNFSYGQINATRYECQTMGANGYLAVLIAALATLPVLVIIYLLMKRFPGQNLIQQGIWIMGNQLGRAIGLVYLLFVLALFAVYSRDTINIIQTYLLEYTPSNFLNAVTLLTAAYLGSRGIETVSRLASFVILPFLLVLLLVVITVISEISVDRLLPLFHLEFNFRGPGGLTILNIFYPMGLLALITPYLKGIHAKLPRLTLLALTILISVSMLYSIGTIGVFGHEYLLSLAYPNLEAVRLIELPYLLLEQIGLFWIVLLFSNVLISSGYFLYLLGLGLSQACGILDYKRFIWILTPIVFILMLLIRNETETKLLAAGFARYGWICLFGYPCFLYLLALIFRKKGNQADVS